MEIVNKAKGALSDVKKYWKNPPKGRYMSFKEITSLSVGGIGIKFITYCVGNMMLAVGNTLIGNTIGIDPTPLYIIYLIGILSGFPLTALRAKMIDNTRSMKGKYRPYILRMGVPTVVLAIGFIWAPYENMTLTGKCITVLLFNIGFQFFYNFMNDAYDSLINVLSPNSIERSDVCSIKAVIENLSPSIAGIFLPIAAKMITGDNTLYNLKVYRYLYPPMLVVGLLISILVYVNTEEKIVRAKTHAVNIKFSDALRAVAKNKYFWVISLASWLGFLESSFNNIMGWMYNYQKACSAGQYSLITAISGNAAFWPNLIAPYFIRKYGKRSILVVTNLLNIVVILGMLPVVRAAGSKGAIWMLLAIMFLNTFISSLGHLMNPSINADIRDYQQYITGERIDGMFAAVGLIGSVITLATSGVLPTLYERAGLNKEVAISLGYSGNNVYDVLFNHDYFVEIAGVLVIASAVGAFMNVVPFFFYDLTETKQKAMVSVLKIRALFEDFGNGVLSDRNLVETIDIIEEAKVYEDKAPVKLSKENIKNAKKTHDKEKIKAAKAQYKEDILTNERIEVASYVMREMNRFETDEGKIAFELAQKTASAGLDGFLNVCVADMKSAKGMPKTNDIEKEKRSAAIMQVQYVKTAVKTIAKYYPNGIEEFDVSVFEKLFSAEDSNEQKLHDTLLQMKKAKESKNTDEVKRLKTEVADLQRIRTEINREIKKATDRNSIYNRAAKPYLEARRIILQKQNYSQYEEIFAKYEEAKMREDEKFGA